MPVKSEQGKIGNVPGASEKAKVPGETVVFAPLMREQASIMFPGLKSAKVQISQSLKSLQEQKTHPLSAELSASFQDRYAKVGHILNVVEALTKLDVNSKTDFKDFFTEALTPLAQAYGFQIVSGDPAQDVAYAEKIQEHATKYRASVIQVPEQELSFIQSEQPTLHADRPDVDMYMNTSQVIPQGRLANHPDVAYYTSVFNHFSDVQQRVYKYFPFPSTKVKFSEEPYPRVISGWRTAEQLLIMAKGILWEGFNGNTIDLALFARYMNEMLQAFDLHVDVKQPEPAQQSIPQQQAVI